MPPEPVPWDRKDFVFKDRRHDRIAAGDALGSIAFCAGGGNSTPRCRDPYYFPRASPRRPPPGSHRQTVSYYQLYDEPNGHGCTPSRSADGFRTTTSGRYSGGGGRSSSRESRGSFRRSPYYDGHVTPQRSVAVPITSPSPNPPLKDLHDKNGGADDQRSDRDRKKDQDCSQGSIAWKTMKWSRQGSIASSSKAARSEIEEAASGSLEVTVSNLGKETPVRSPVSSPLLSDDGAPKKKPRLTWGQGLAKYEKQKVGGSSANSGKDQASETSLKVMGFAGSTSPKTPCSAAPTSSPGMEYRPFSRAVNVDNEANHHTEALALGCQNCPEELPVTDHLISTSALTSLLNDLLMPEDACTGDSTSNRSTAPDKLVSFKAGVSKELEKTECEIDLLETELKSLTNVDESVACQISFTLHNSLSLPCVESADISTRLLSNSTSVTYVTTVEEPALDVVYLSGEMASSDNVKPLSLCNADTVALPIEERAETENVSGGANNLDVGNNSVNDNLNINQYAEASNDFVDLIMASNRDAAKRASQVLDGALPTSSEQLDIWGSDRMLLCRKNDMHVREKIASQKHQLKFKERVLALKFRALHHLWKEDLRLLSVKKQRPKSQKRLELCSRLSQSSSQKHRSSIRSQFKLPAGNTTLVPTADIVEFTSKLLSDPRIKVFRNNLKMPALILDEKERRYSRFITNNNLVEDPISSEKERSMINPWTKEEEKVFMDMLAEYGKDFAKISSFLSHKTTADCIEFYYKHHKSESFRDVKKQLDLRKQRQSLPSNTYLLPASGKMWNRDENAGSLDILGAVSVAAAHNNTRSQHKYAGKSIFHRSKVSCENVSNVEVSVHEKETTAAEMLAGISAALSSEAVSSCVTSSISPSEKNYLRTERPLTPGVTQIIEEDTFSDEGCVEVDSVDWTDDEKSLFIRALRMYGKDFSRISDCVRTKSRDQCKIFFSKARKCLGLDQVHLGSVDGATPTSDANGGRSETDDPCAAEMDSAICSTQSCSKMDVDYTQAQCAVNVSCEPFLQVGPKSLRIEIDRSVEMYEIGVSSKMKVDGKVGADESVVKVEVQEILKSDESEKAMFDVPSEVNEQGPYCDGAELLAHRESSIVGAGLLVSSDESIILPSSEGDELKGHTSERGSTDEGVRNDVVMLPVLASDAGSVERPQEETEIDKIDQHEFSFAAECNGNGNASSSAPKLNACSNPTFNFATGHEHQVTLELPPSLQKKPRQLSYMLDNAYPVPLSTFLPDPSSFCFEGSHRAAAFNYQDHLRKLHQVSSAGELYQQYLSRISFSQAHPSSHVLSGYPVQLLNQKELKTGTNMHERCSNGDMSSQFGRCFSQDIYNDRVDSSSTQSRMGVLFSQRSDDASDSQLRPCSTSCQETNEQSTLRTGDFKLFGQKIPTNHLSSQKSNPSPQENGGQPQSPKQKKPAHLDVSTSNSSFFTGQSRLEEVPLQSYGFWDGNRIQTGFSSLPTPFYSIEDGVVSSSSEVSTSFQQAYAPTLSANGKRVDNFSELQKRNGFELVSGFQQGGGRAAMARLGVNMAGANRGILVGPAGLSDPVTALKLVKLYNGEVDSWTRDLNGR